MAMYESRDFVNANANAVGHAQSSFSMCHCRFRRDLAAYSMQPFTSSLMAHVTMAVRSRRVRKLGPVHMMTGDSRIVKMPLTLVPRVLGSAISTTKCHQRRRCIEILAGLTKGLWLHVGPCPLAPVLLWLLWITVRGVCRLPSIGAVDMCVLRIPIAIAGL
jgi:hypothetical protein